MWTLASYTEKSYRSSSSLQTAAEIEGLQAMVSALSRIIIIMKLLYKDLSPCRGVKGVCVIEHSIVCIDTVSIYTLYVLTSWGGG